MPLILAATVWALIMFAMIAVFVWGRAARESCDAEGGHIKAVDNGWTCLHPTKTPTTTTSP